MTGKLYSRLSHLSLTFKVCNSLANPKNCWAQHIGTGLLNPILLMKTTNRWNQYMYHRDSDEIPTMKPILYRYDANLQPLFLFGLGLRTRQLLSYAVQHIQAQIQRKNYGHSSNLDHSFSQGVNSLNFPDPLRVPFSPHFLILSNYPNPLFGKLFVARANLM